MSKAPSRSAFFFTAALAASVAGCSSGNDGPTMDPNLYKSLLYMTDTYSGKIYTYDPSTHAASGSSLAAVGQNSTGEIAFHAGIGYACVGYGVDAGVYCFDPSAANPSFSKIPGTICASYCAFASDTKAYVSVFDYATDADGIYTFDPSAPGSGISASRIPGTEGDAFQEIVIGSDGYLYAANNTDATVLRIDTATDSVVAVIEATAGGTTGLAVGTYAGASGVFAANTAGSIDFVPSTAANGSDAIAVVADSIYAGRVLQLPNGNLIATGYDPLYASHTYLVDLSGEGAAATEILCGGSSFGSLDIAYKDGLIYVPVPDYGGDSDSLYVFDAEGAQAPYSPVTGIMGAGDAIANIAFYED